MMTLFHKPRSPNGLKVLIMLEEAGIPYVICSPESTGDAFNETSPMGTVPALLDEETGAKVFESSAILLYLAEKSGSFLPTDLAARYEAIKWLVFEAANIGPACESIYQLSATLPDNEEHIVDLYRAKLRNLAAILDGQLDGKEYLAGACSIADFNLYPWMLMLDDFADVPLQRFANIAAWLERMEKRPAVAKAHAANA